MTAVGAGATLVVAAAAATAAILAIVR